MNWNKLLNVFISIFVIINLTLFGYQQIYERNKYQISEARLAQMSDILRLNEYTLYESAPDYYPMNQIEIQAPNINKQSIANKVFLEGEVPETKLVNTLGEELSTDTQSLTFYGGDQKGLIYYEGTNKRYKPKDLTVTSVETVAKRFSQDLFGSDVDMVITYKKEVNGTYQLELNEKYKERLIFQSYIKLTMTSEGIKEALAIRYEPKSAIGTKKSIYPFDEVIYSLIYYLEEESNEDISSQEYGSKHIQDVDIGYYVLDEDSRRLLYQVDPYYRITFLNGERYYVNAFTNIIYKP